MNFINVEEDEEVVINPSRDKKIVLRIVITEGTTAIARALMYRIVCDNTFGSDRSIFISLYDSHEYAMFLESVAIEITASAPNILDGINYSDDPSIAFKDADVVFSIGKARGYEFTKEEFTDLLFEKSVLVAKLHGEAIGRYAKKDVKVIALGNTAAKVLLKYARSIPQKNVTALSILALKKTAAHIAAKVQRRPNEIKNLIVWGTNGKKVLPDCTYATFKNGLRVCDKVGNVPWLKRDLVHKVQSSTNQSWFIRSTAYALADHCKLLWQGTPEGEWTCMAVSSDNSYGIPLEIFFSFPVYCKDGKYEIVQGLMIDEYVRRRLKMIVAAIKEETVAALELCHSSK